jgi:hypothetical protein
MHATTVIKDLLAVNMAGEQMFFKKTHQHILEGEMMIVLHDNPQLPPFPASTFSQLTTQQSWNQTVQYHVAFLPSSLIINHHHHRRP